MPIVTIALRSPRLVQIRFLLAPLLLAGLLLPIAARSQVTFNGVQNNLGSGFNSPYGVALDRSGDVYVADYSNSAVYEIVASGGAVSSTSTVTTLAVPSGGYGHPSGIAVDGNGNVFVADTGNNALYETVAANGVVNGSSTVNKLALTGLPTSGSLGGIAVDGSGDVFVAYPGNGAVFEIVASGGTVSSNSIVNSLPTPNGGYGQPSGVAVDGSGDIFVGDADNDAVYEIAAGTSTVNRLTAFASAAGNVAADRIGNVFVINTSNSNVYEIFASGGYTAENLVATGLTSPKGVAVDGNGNLFVASAGSSSVAELALDGVNFGSQSIGTPSATISLPFTIATQGSTIVASVAILTAGSVGKDFADGGSSTCVATTYSSITNCVINVAFNPLGAGLRRGAVVFFNGSGSVLATVPVYGLGNGPQVDFLPGTQSALAPGTFASPTGVAVDGNGNVFVADYGGQDGGPNNGGRIYEVLAAGGYTTVKTLGSGFNQPTGVAVDGSGNVFVADYYNQAVKEILAAGGYTTTRIVGSGFSGPFAVAVDGMGNVFVADALTNQVYEVPIASGYTTVNTLGSGFNGPTGVAIDGTGNVFVADFGNNQVKEILAAGGYTTVKLLGSGFGLPYGVAVDSNGSVFVADSANHVIKEILPAGGYTTIINVNVSFQNPSQGVGFVTPTDVALDGSGNLFVTDFTGPVKKLDLADPPSLSFAATQVNSTSTDSPQTVEVQNIGNQALTLTSLIYPTDFPEGSGDASACTGSTSLNPSLQCDPRVDFTPLSPASLSESILLADNALNVTGATQSIGVNGSGQATPVISWSTPSPITYGTPLSAAQLNATSTVPGSFAYGPALGTVLTAGSQKLSLTFTPTNTANYTTASAIVNLAVNQATPSITWPTPAAIPYGTALSIAQLNATASVAGSLAYTPVAGTVLTAGSHLLSATFAPTDTTDYTPAAGQVTLQVNKVIPVISWTPAALPRGKSLGAAQLDATASVPGSFTYTPPSGTVITTTKQILSLIFTPTDITDYNTASMSVPLTVTTGPLASVSPSSINFGSVYLNTITTNNVTVTNQGSAPLTITNPLISNLKGGNSNEFFAYNLCPASLATGKSCTISVLFEAGTVYTTQTATLNVTDNSPVNPQTVSLTAVVINPLVQLSTSGLNFGTQKVNTSSNAKAVTLTNTGTTSLTITGIDITGANPRDFSETNNCPSSLAVRSSCTIDLTFKPAAKGLRSGSVVISDNAQNSPQSISLSGTGN